MPEAMWIAFAFILGIAVRPLGLPPLVGFLLAGFALNALQAPLNLPHPEPDALSHLAHVGVLLLLFTVGLKLRVRTLLRPEVIGGGLIHFGLTVGVLTPAIVVVMGLDWRTGVLLAIALAFSSTVVAAKVLEAKRELKAFHGRVAIGILIVQDLIALLVMSIAGGHAPSIWAVGLFALPLLRPLLHRMLDAIGHDELLVLLGLLMALVIGGAGFELVGLSSELGALVIGALLAGHPRSQELANALWGIKEIVLVGFFLQIGMSGLPDWHALAFALVFALVLPLKAVLFFGLLTRFKLRARSSFLTGLSLASYSEFALIVAAVALPDWLVPLAIAVALSFVFAAPLNRMAHGLYRRWEMPLARFESNANHPDEQPVSLGRAHVLVMGMGRSGTSAYDFLRKRGLHLVGLDSDHVKVERHITAGRRVLYADAEDQGFWAGVNLEHIEAVVLTMNDDEAKRIAARELRRLGFAGVIMAHAMFEDEAEAIRAAGANDAYLTMAGAGEGLAERVWEALHPDKVPAAPAD